MEIPPPNQQIMQKLSKTVRETVRFTIDQHADAAVEIPAQDDDVVACLDGGLAEGPKIGLAID
jgi:hypothetical protein